MSRTAASDILYSHIREIPDFPKPGILFRDITPLLLDPAALAQAVDLLVAPFDPTAIDRVVAIEARGFLVAAPAAMRLGAGLVPVRKIGKLPRETRRVEYALEYGRDGLEMHLDALGPGHRALIVDDVLATGGTAAATIKLVEESRAVVAGLAFLIELTDLGGRGALGAHPMHAVLRFPRS